MRDVLQAVMASDDEEEEEDREGFQRHREVLPPTPSQV